jgi:hypothetical protein
MGKSPYYSKTNNINTTTSFASNVSVMLFFNISITKTSKVYVGILLGSFTVQSINFAYIKQSDIGTVVPLDYAIGNQNVPR